MLTIKRVPTVVSNYQEGNEENGDDPEQKEINGCGQNCLGNCCLPTSNFSLYCIKKEEANSNENRTCKEKPRIPSLLSLLLEQWTDRMSRGLFRYDVTKCEIKIIPGIHRFTAQLNEGRHLKKRPTEFRVDQVIQPFDNNKFNFTKAGQEEVLLMFEESEDSTSHYFVNAPVSSKYNSPNIIAINVSPIEYGHSLLIPRVADCLPQRIDHESFWLAISFAKEVDDPFYRVGYNSLGAFATINHLHFQAYYLAIPFPVENALTQRITEGMENKGVSVSKLLNYPVQGLLFEGVKARNMSNAVASSCIYLQDHNIPFNVLISDCGKKVFLFPQCYAEKQAHGEVSQELLDTQVNPAVWEISGHIVLKRRQDYDNASETRVCKLLAEVSLLEARFEEVKACILEAAGLNAAVVDLETGHSIYEEPSSMLLSSGPMPSHMHQHCLVLQ